MNRTLHASLGLVIGLTIACQPPPEATLLSAEEIGVLGPSATVQGRDGGYSAALWDRSVWIYGDTVLGAEDEDGTSWHHNSYAVTSDLSAADGIDGFTAPVDSVGAPRYFIAPTDEERAFNIAHRGEDCAEEPCGARWAVWPGDAIYDPERDQALIFYSKIYAEPGPFNFRGVGQSIALWDGLAEETVRPELSPGHEHPTQLFHEDEPAFGLGPNLVDGYLVSFACPVDFVVHECIVARVAMSEALDRDAWRFWDGDEWVEDWRDADVVMDGAPIMDIFFNAHLGRFVAIYSRPFGTEVVMRTAPALTGPWSAELLLFRADSEGDVYDALPHVEYAEGDGRVQYITYSRPTGEAWLATEFPIVRVEFE